jgi:outer membrane lipoprotein carrier protein
MKNRLPSLCVLFALLVPAMNAENSARAIAGLVDSYYNHLQTLQTHFVESYRGAGLDRQESGTLLLKRPGRMRWEYKQPQDKLFVTNGKQAWFYVPGERQARLTKLKDVDDLRSPLAYLLGKTRLEKQFNALSLAPDLRPEQPGNTMLRGVPKFLPQVSLVLFEIAPQGRIARLVVEQEDGATVEYGFSDAKENAPIADSQFQFSPPPGVEVISARPGD